MRFLTFLDMHERQKYLTKHFKDLSSTLFCHFSRIIKKIKREYI